MKDLKLRTFVFAGGGTGGHIYPGLAVAGELRRLAASKNEKIRIVWIGNSAGMDRNLVEKSGEADLFYGVPSGKLRRCFSFQNFLDLFKIAAGFVKSFFFLLKVKPDVLFSKGGFVSVPPCVAAHFLHIKTFTHECDFTPGLATRINSRFVSKILVSYEETKKYFSQKNQDKIIVTGNPVRHEFYTADPERGRKFLFTGRQDYNPSKPVLLVVGGSLGAHQINALVAENLEWLVSRFNVVHQCGARDADEMPKNVSGYFLYPFIYSEMPNVLAAADIVLGRAGANSIWEFSALGKPMVLLPLCGSGTRGDQVDNAEYFAVSGAAEVLLGKDATSENLKNALEKLLDEKTRLGFAAASKKLSDGKNPARKIAEIIYDV